MSKRNPWDEVARTYEEIRPSYPDHLIQDITDRARLTRDSCLLEIGAGTGKATVQFAERGFRIHCIEPGKNLADVLMQKCSRYPKVSIDIVSFEEWTPAENAGFDLIFCAQAFDYIDAEVRYRKCHQLLKEDGHLALFWYGHEAESWETEIVASGLFEHPQIFDYHSECVLDTESQVKTMESTSTFAILDDEAKSRMREDKRREVEKQGGSVTVGLNYRLYLSKRLVVGR